MFGRKRHNIIVEEKDVTTVLLVINRHQGYFSDKNKLVGYCGWEEEPTKWFIRFGASFRDWRHMVRELNEFGTITTGVDHGIITDLYFVRKDLYFVRNEL